MHLSTLKDRTTRTLAILHSVVILWPTTYDPWGVIKMMTAQAQVAKSLGFGRVEADA